MKNKEKLPSHKIPTDTPPDNGLIWDNGGLPSMGWVPRKAGYLTDPVKKRNSDVTIIIVANNI